MHDEHDSRRHHDDCQNPDVDGRAAAGVVASRARKLSLAVTPTTDRK
jgi:hypothetical protein